MGQGLLHPQPTAGKPPDHTCLSQPRPGGGRLPQRGCGSPAVRSARRRPSARWRKGCTCACLRASIRVVPWGVGADHEGGDIAPGHSSRSPCAGFASVFPWRSFSEVFLRPCALTLLPQAQVSPLFGEGGSARPQRVSLPSLSPLVSLGKFQRVQDYLGGWEELTGPEPLMCASLCVTREGTHPAPTLRDGRVSAVALLPPDTLPLR